MNKKIISLSLVILLVITIFQFAFTSTSVMAATIVLPVGSTETDLQEAINNATDDDIIELSNDISLSSALTVNGKEITIKSTGSLVYSLIQGSNQRHFLIQSNGNLTLESILLYGQNPGGGLNIDTSSSATISTGTIIMNCENELGGAIYSEGNLSVNGGTFRNNSAEHGGAIYTTNTSYSNIITDSATVFEGNTASIASNPPENASTLYPAIQFASTSIANHPLNNYDINYLGQPITVNITYNANGGTGNHIGPSIAPGRTDTVLSIAATEIRRDGYTFIGWNTAADGSGTSYAPGAVITLEDNVTLYAQWEQNDMINYWMLILLFLLILVLLILVIKYIKSRNKKC